MSNATLRARRFAGEAQRLELRGLGVRLAKCVPVTTTAAAAAMKASSMSSSPSAMSAQFSR